MIADRRNEYNGFAKTLHWLIVLLLVGQFAIAWTMPDVHRDTKPEGLIAWHLSVGAIILLVMLIRLGWRIATRVPAAPADLPGPLQLLSRATHFLFYALLIVLPLLGWANASARGWDVRLFGVIKLPALASAGSPLGMQLGDVHMTVALVLLAFVALHILGALYHQVVLRDNLLRRMVS